MRAGFATVDITPPVGAVLDGFFARSSPSTGVDSPIMLSALCLEAGGPPAMLVSLDLIGLTRPTHLRWLRRLETELALQPGGVVFACSHTHSGPMSFPIRGIGDEDHAYMASVEEALIQAARRALAGLREATVAWGETPFRLGMNRREKHGGQSQLGRNAQGPADDLARVLRIDCAGRTIVVFGHASHPYCLGAGDTLISADFCGHAVASLRDAGIEAMFVNGCSGNIAPIEAGKGPAAARSEGRRLADAVLRVLRETPAAHPGDDLSVVSRPIALPHDAPPVLDDVRRLVEGVVDDMRRAAPTNPDKSAATRMERGMRGWLADLAAAMAGGSLPMIESRVSALRVGGRAMAFMPGEVFFEIGQRVGEMAGDPRVWSVAYAHEFVGYIPTAEEIPFGGYEVDQAHRYLGLWRVAPTAAETLARAAARVVRESLNKGA